MIQELKNHLHQVLKFSEGSLLRTRQEAEKQQKADARASQARLAKVQQEILTLRSQYHSLVAENQEAEQALRKVPQGPWAAASAGQGQLEEGTGGRPRRPGRREGTPQARSWVPAVTAGASLPPRPCRTGSPPVGRHAEDSGQGPQAN